MRKTGNLFKGQMSWRLRFVKIQFTKHIPAQHIDNSTGFYYLQVFGEVLTGSAKFKDPWMGLDIKFKCMFEVTLNDTPKQATVATFNIRKFATNQPKLDVFIKNLIAVSNPELNSHLIQYIRRAT